MPHADLILPVPDDGSGPAVRLTRDDGEVIDMTLEEAWGRVEDGQTGVGITGGQCHCEPCALFSCIRHLR